MQSGPEIVRSDHQRWLLDYWASRSRAESLPVWRGLDAGDIAVPFDNLAWMEVIDVNGDPRFMVKFHGSQLSDALGPIDGLGKFIDDFLPPSYLGAAIRTYRKVLSTRGPVYTVSDMRDPAGRMSTTSACCCRSPTAAPPSTASSPRLRRRARKVPLRCGT